jgi:hypothetical protein
VFAFPSAPIDTPTLSPFPTLPLARSLGDNEIGAEGVTALAAVLKETQITNLECAAAQVFAFVSMPTDTPTLPPFPALPFAHRLGGNNIGAEGTTALAAILKETQIINLGCATARVFAFVSMPVDTPTLSLSPPLAAAYSLTIPTPHCSLQDNMIRDQGASALAAILKQTMITHLECAAAP